MKVYAVTEGCYSDYHICGITLDKEAAEAFVEKYPDCNIEEYDTDDIEFVKRGCTLYCIVLNKDGDLIEINEAEGYYLDWINCVHEIRRRNASGRWRNTGLYKVTVSAVDEDHAVKIAADLIAQYRHGKER